MARSWRAMHASDIFMYMETHVSMYKGKQLEH